MSGGVLRGGSLCQAVPPVPRGGQENKKGIMSECV